MPDKRNPDSLVEHTDTIIVVMMVMATMLVNVIVIIVTGVFDFNSFILHIQKNLLPNTIQSVRAISC